MRVLIIIEKNKNNKMYDLETSCKTRDQRQLTMFFMVLNKLKMF